MAARKKSSSSTVASGTFFTKDLFIFILILAIVAIVTYVLTYNAITSKIDKQIEANYGVPANAQQITPAE